jgi:hypothetical protein
MFQGILAFKIATNDKEGYCNLKTFKDSSAGNTNGTSATSKDITSFSFAMAQTGLNKDYVGTITGTTINVEIPYGVGLTLIPTFTTTGKTVTIATTTQTSGTTSNSFNTNVTYTVTAEDKSTQDYTVSVYQITPVADTGQTACFNNATYTASCPTITASFPNQDGELVNFPNAKGVQTSSTNTGYPNDPINKDTLKGIVWKTCHEGQTGSTCAGGAAGHTHSSATSACSNLNLANSGAGYAGLKNWRLPNIHELSQLLEMNGSANNATPTYWNPTLFPNAPSGASQRWTSSLLLPAGSNAMTQEADYIKNRGIVSTYLAHCVSGQPLPNFDMVNQGDGTILDKRTKLIWQRCAFGQTNDATCSGAFATKSWSNSMIDCKNLTFSGKQGRLPNVNEIITLLDFTLTTAIKVNTTLFPSFGGGQYETSSTNLTNVVYSHILVINNTEFQGVSGKGSVINSRCLAGP